MNIMKEIIYAEMRGKMKGLIVDALKNFKVVLFRLAFLVSIAFSSLIYVYLNNYRGRVYHIQTALDQAIPFNKYFIVPYVVWYIYLGIFFFYYAVYDEKKYFKILASIIIGMLICYVIYYFFPTYVPRPQVVGNDIFAKAVRFIYNRDNPYNCFPSIHVLESVIIAVYVNRDLVLGYKVKLASTVTAILIILSTLYIKQHYIYDAVSAGAMAYGLYFIFNYREILTKINGKTIIANITED